MASSFITSLFVIYLCVIVRFALNLDYRDLEDMGATCPGQDSCRGYQNDDYNWLSTGIQQDKDDREIIFSRNCECDSACHTYQDCCIDVRGRSSGEKASNMICLNNGMGRGAGIYAVSQCSRIWNGPKEVKLKCEGPLDLSDPVLAAPVTSTSKLVTYKNRYCAECNDDDTNSLKMFDIRIRCPGLGRLSQEAMMDLISYNNLNKKWGYIQDIGRNPGFKECEILFYLPDSLNRSVRFCRRNIVSKCAPDWTGPQVKKACDEYMAVVYHGKTYKNPHCAICNNVNITKILCHSIDVQKNKRFSLMRLLDINNFDCSSKHMYDPFFKKCRKLSCVLPGYVVKNGKCVPGG